MSDISPIALQLILSGQDTVKSGLKDTASGLKDVTTAAQETAAQLKNAVNVGGANAWSPAIAALRQLKAEEKAAGDAAKQLANDQKQASKDATDAAKQLVQAQRDAVAAGAASNWSPQIGAVKQLAQEEKGAADAARQLASAQQATLSSGAASAWSPQIGAVKQYQYQLQQANQQQQQFQQNLSTLRTTGMMMGMAGVAVMRGTGKAREVSSDDLGDKQRIADLAGDQGRGGDLSAINSSVDDIAARGHLADKKGVRQAAVSMMSDEVQTKDLNPLLEAATRNSITLKKGMDEVGEAFSKAYTEGSLTRLKRINILFSEQEEASVKAAFGISQAAGQQEFMRVVMAATNRDTVKLGQGLTDAQKAANDFAREGREAMDEFGAGAAEAKREQDALGMGIVRTLNTTPGFLKATGYVSQFSGELLTAAGSVLGLGSQAALTLNALQSMGVTGASAIGLIQTAAITALPYLTTLAAVALSLKAGQMAFHLGEQKEDLDEVQNIEAHNKTWDAKTKMQAMQHLLKNLDAEGETGQAAQIRDKYAGVAATKEGQAAIAADKSLALQDTPEQAAKKQSDDFLAQMKAMQSGTGSAPAGMAGSGNASGAAFAGDGEDYQNEIRAIEDRKDGEGKNARAADNIKLRHLREAMQDQKKAQSAAGKVAREEGRESDAEALGAAKERGAQEKADAESRIEAMHAAYEQERRADEDSETAQIRAYEDAHKRTRDGDLTSFNTIHALLKAGFSDGQIINARKVEEAAKKAARADGDVDETEKSRHLEDIRTAFHRHEADSAEAERRDEKRIRVDGAADAALEIAHAQSDSSNPLTRIRGGAGADVAETRGSGNVSPQVQSQRDLGNGKIEITFQTLVVDAGNSIRNGIANHQARGRARMGVMAGSY